MQSFRKKKIQLLIATDVAARGIDVDDITHVINYQLPDEIEIYTHRSGRTGRAGSKGSTICFISPEEQLLWDQIDYLLNPKTAKKPSGSNKNSRSVRKRSGSQHQSSRSGRSFSTSNGPRRSNGTRRSSEGNTDSRPSRSSGPRRSTNGNTFSKTARSSGPRRSSEGNTDSRPSRSSGPRRSANGNTFAKPNRGSSQNRNTSGSRSKTLGLDKGVIGNGKSEKYYNNCPCRSWTNNINRLNYETKRNVSRKSKY